MNCLRVFKKLQLRPVYFCQISAKCFTNHAIKFKETENKWKEKDGVSKRWHLIYKAPMHDLLNYLSVYLTITTSAFGISAAYYAAFVFNIDDMNTPVLLGEDVVVANSAVECLIYIGAFLGFHIAVKVLLSKYVLRLYKNGDQYLAVFRGHLFNSVKKHEFHLNDFKKLNPTFVVSWGDARFALGNKHGIILENYFKTPEYFNHLLYKKNFDDFKSEED